jgi:hypothetical protein
LPDPFADEREALAVDQSLVTVRDGDEIRLNRNDMYLRVVSGSTSTAITTPSADQQPFGLRFTIDNSEGSGAFTVNVSEITVPAGEVYEVKVVGDGNGSKQFRVPGPAEPTNTITTESALQAAIDNDVALNQVTTLPIGEIELTAALTVDDGTGGSVLGQGVSDPIVGEGYEKLYNHTTIRYVGTKGAGQSAIEIQRSDWNLNNVNLFGQTATDLYNDTGTRTPRGIYITRGATAGTGKYELHRVALAGFGCAIDCGGSLGEGNCDESGYDHIFSFRNDIFFRSNNEQGLSHKFYNLRATDTTTVFDYYAGGKMAVTDLFIGGPAPCTILQLRNDEPTGFGANGSVWRFRGIDLDAAAVNTRLLNVEPGIGYYSYVHFDGVHLPPDTWTNSGIHVGDNMTVVVDNIVNLPPNFVTWDTITNTSCVIFNNPKAYTSLTTPADIFDLSNSIGNLRCIVNTGFQYDTYTLFNSGTLYNEILAGV